ncbi:tetratricopeptide repeat protein [Oxyplasma meridianum]|uniref:Tetratricopeptide repeat protein n=1 Tax=Oxyplasma meridianum TaxID=3073602 RepID=A0AAX4NFU1_9ARCH
MDEIEQAIKSGDTFLQKDKFMDSIREYTKAYELMKEDNGDKAELCYKLSQAYYALEPKNTENSGKFGKESLAIHEKLKETDMIVMDYLNLGYIYMDAKKLEETDQFFSLAIKKADEAEDPVLYSMSLNALGELYSNWKGRTAKALEIYNKVLEISKEVEDWDNYFEAMRGKISIEREKDTDKAFKLSMEALDFIDKISSKIKNKKERKEFVKSMEFMYDLASDMAMEKEDVDQAMKIAQRLDSV